MSSLEDKSRDTTAISQQMSTINTAESLDKENQKQLFSLIDTVLSFEACLYHQILPFKLENNHLLLGIVNPENEEALNYVSSILAYMNCTITTKPILADAHRKILSTYLNHKNKSTGAVIGGASHLAKASVNDISVNDNPSPIREKIQADGLPISTEFKPANSLPILNLPETDPLIAIDKILILPPRKILEELLARVLTGGIGRLYLERRPYHGRILWSENGVVQSVLEELQLSVFQGVLNELKRFTDQPIATIAEAQQVEKEYIYQKQRLLLRLRVMPGMYGEEGTLQVLRGAALKFYQNQQVSRLSEDALSISQQLSYKLHELQAKLLRSSSNNPEKVESLKSLNRLLKNLDKQIKSITY